MIPQLILMTIAGLAASISKLISAGADKAAQEEALMEAAEASKRGLDFVRFGTVTETPTPDTQPGA
ncbi:MAG TPA: hypothetical protein VJW73_10970 [Gemmatimonadaceae bacterium]|nr:hypothetical protein [Gemmatimonadaceae bacterium]